MRTTAHDDVPDDAPVGFDHYGVEYAAKLLVSWLEAHKEATERLVLDTLNRFRELRCSDEQARAVVGYALAARLIHVCETRFDTSGSEPAPVYRPGPPPQTFFLGGTTTGRTSSARPNIQQTPRRGKSGA